MFTGTNILYRRTLFNRAQERRCVTLLLPYTVIVSYHCYRIIVNMVNCYREPVIYTLALQILNIHFIQTDVWCFIPVYNCQTYCTHQTDLNIRVVSIVHSFLRKTSICRGHFHCSKTTCPSPCARSISRARPQGMVEILCVYFTVMFLLALALDFVLPQIAACRGSFVFCLFFIPCLFVFILYSFSNYFVYFPNNWKLNLDSTPSIKEVCLLICNKPPVQTFEYN